MAYQKYKDIPNRREPLAGRDHIQHIENALGGVVPGPGEVIVGGADGPVRVKLADLGIDWTPGYTDRDRTLSVIGDLHVGFGTTPEIQAAAVTRMDQTFSDLATLNGQYGKRLYAGDLVEAVDGTATELGPSDIDVLGRMNALDDDWDAVPGNHDIRHNVRTASQWAALYGYSNPNWAKDYGPFRVIAVTPEEAADYNTLPQTALDFLNDQLAASSNLTVILSHYPLRSTVGAHPVDGQMSSFGADDSTVYAGPDEGIRAILDAHPHAKLWIGAHRHNPVSAPDLFTHSWTGSRNIAVVNVGAPVYTDHRVGPQGDDPPRSYFLTVREDGVGIRVRNHRDSAWEPYQGQDVYTLPWEPAVSGNPAAMVMTFNDAISGIDANGPVAHTLVGSGTESFVTVNGRRGLLVPGSRRVRVDPRNWISTTTGSVVVRARFEAADNPGTRGYPVWHHPTGTQGRIFISREAADAATPGVSGRFGQSGVWATANTSCLDTDVHTFGISWHDGWRCVLYIDGKPEAEGRSLRDDYGLMDVIGDAMEFGVGVDMTLLDVFVSGRRLTDEEHAALHAEAGPWDWDTLA